MRRKRRSNPSIILVNLPTDEQIEKIRNQCNVPDNIRRHMDQVARVAVLIATKFNDAGIKVNTRQIECAAKLHDIAKLKEKELGKRHEELGKEIVQKEGFPDVAELISCHGFIDIIKHDFKNWEEKILQYSDKRVAHDEIVSLKERFDEARKRYPDGGETQKQGEAKTFEREKEIFDSIDLTPEDVSRLLK